MTSKTLDAYMLQLERTLERQGLINPRIIAEAREHLADAIAAGLERGLSPDTAEREALVRFGTPDELTEEFRRVYRWDFLVWYLAKIAASVVASVAVALVIQVLANLRLEFQTEAWRLAPGFSRAAIMSVAVVLGLATAWEIGRPPFGVRRATLAIGIYATVCIVVQVLYAQGVAAFGAATLLVCLGWLCSRLERRPAKLLLTFAMFAAAIFTIHRTLHIVMDPARAALASAVLIAVWTSTITILSRGDRLFSSLSNCFATPQG
jgi:hypothetical protein